MAKSHDELVEMANLQWSRSLQPTAGERSAATASAAVTAAAGVTPDVPEHRAVQREGRGERAGISLGL